MIVFANFMLQLRVVEKGITLKPSHLRRFRPPLASLWIKSTGLGLRIVHRNSGRPRFPEAHVSLSRNSSSSGYFTTCHTVVVLGPATVHLCLTVSSQGDKYWEDYLPSTKSYDEVAMFFSAHTGSSNTPRGPCTGGVLRYLCDVLDVKLFGVPITRPGQRETSYLRLLLTLGGRWVAPRKRRTSTLGEI